MKVRFEKEFDMDFDAREGRKCLPYLQDIMFPKSFGYPGAILSQVFLFDSPSTFFQHVELCLLFQSMYVSIWATQLIPLTVNNPGWAIALTIPMCCNFLIIQLLLHDAVILKAVCEIHDNAIVETEEEEEMEETCIEKMREKLEENYSQEKAEKERRSEVAALKHVWLEKEFMKFDKDKSGEISCSELQEFLSVSLQIKFSTKELKTLWLAIDEDLSGEVQWHEFYTAIFPDEKDVIKHELEIVKTCQNLVFTRMAELGLEASSVSDYLRGLFDKYDEDKSGSIECDEFTLLIKGITGPTQAPTDKEMRSMFAAIDFDKGGGIDFEEFEKLLTPPRDKLQKVLTKVHAQSQSPVATTTSPVEIATGEEGTAV
jgi:Ca2+-binding EF-hand superfamily protein